MNVGVKHFVEPEWFLQIMPPQFPNHYAAVYLSGFFELLFGFMLIIPKTRFLAGWRELNECNRSNMGLDHSDKPNKMQLSRVFVLRLSLF